MCILARRTHYTDIFIVYTTGSIPIFTLLHFNGTSVIFAFICRPYWIQVVYQRGSISNNSHLCETFFKCLPGEVKNQN